MRGCGGPLVVPHCLILDRAELFYAHVSIVHCPLSRHTFLLIFLHPLLSVRGSHAEVTFDKRFLSTIYLFIIKVCPHKPQATIRLTFHREIAGVLCCHAIVPANATITNIRRSISPPFCIQEKKLLHQSSILHQSAQRFGWTHSVTSGPIDRTPSFPGSDNNYEDDALLGVDYGKLSGSV